jgi:glycosyltransferase involved in cell wall biosynthesis
VVNKESRKRIAALVPNVLGFSPGQRVRIELWAPYLREAGWEIEFFPFEDEALHDVLYDRGKSMQKAAGLLRCYWRQVNRVMERFSADVIFIFREASLIGPAILERLAARQGVPILFDIDDPVFLPYKSPTNNWASLLKFSRKTHTLFKKSTRIIAINKLIGDYAARFNPNVTIIPNCIDTDKYRPREFGGNSTGTVNLLWIGSQSTMQNLAMLANPIQRLQAEYCAPLTIIGAGNVDLGIRDLKVKQWSAETEVADLRSGDIGLLPLNDQPWNRWKFFFKAVQYMAVGIPVVARDMGSNREIIEDGVNGFLAETEEEWFDRLRILAADPQLRAEMGKAARKTVVERFSVHSQMPIVVKVFEDLIGDR